MSDEQTTPQGEPQPTPEAGQAPHTQEFSVTGEQVVDFVKKALHEGNIRRIRLIRDGKTLFEIPLSIGAPAAAVGIMVAPVLAAVGAFAALVTECTIEVEKIDETKTP